MPRKEKRVECTLCGSSCSCHYEHNHEFVCHNKNCPLHKPTTYEYYRGKVYLEDDPILDEFGPPPGTTDYSSSQSGSDYLSDSDEYEDSPGRSGRRRNEYGSSSTRDYSRTRQHKDDIKVQDEYGGWRYYPAGSINVDDEYSKRSYPAGSRSSSRSSHHSSSSRPSSYHADYDAPRTKPSSSRRSSYYEEPREENPSTPRGSSFYDTEDERGYTSSGYTSSGSSRPKSYHSDTYTSASSNSSSSSRPKSDYDSSSSSRSGGRNYYGRTPHYGPDADDLRREFRKMKEKNGQYPNGHDSASWVCLWEIRELGPYEKKVHYLPPAPFVYECTEDPDGKVIEVGRGHDDYDDYDDEYDTDAGSWR